MKCAPTTLYAATASGTSPPVLRRSGGPDPRIRSPLVVPEFLPFRFGSIFSKMVFDSTRAPEIYEGLSLRAWRVLALLASYPDITNAEMSALFGMDTATVTRAVAELKSKGLITTNRDPSDRRRVQNRLTDAGAALHDRIAPARIARGRRYEACFTPEELTQLHRLLDKLSRHVDAIFIEEWREERRRAAV
ncbi:transcriptional regulator, MarR family protein [Rhodospirillum centenum SW]|uniref:Transcriptional regulator, MarR family protein n=1 Tax=Rhodospirillum centenum (strain ATCC 51521 / SW) TaxID=414684 RepID=B6IQ58_RHOCS|nr:transcriptional regulator, MarR family protein [Rhodospirillum centenum SW]